MSETKYVPSGLEQRGTGAFSPAPLEAGNSAKGFCAPSRHCLVSELCAVVLKELLIVTGLPCTGICSALFTAGILPLLTRVQPQTANFGPKARC